MRIRCPHCHNSLDLRDDSEFDNVSCPSCGSSFSLVGTEETQEFSPTVKKTVAHFTLVEQLGYGAFGTVWKAYDVELDRDVAVKIPLKSRLERKEADTFLREARAAAQLNHPNIVAVHEVGREEETIFIVSDYIEGVTLTDWLTGHQPNAREAAELCSKLADALHHAHEKGVIHRDLKPGNIMLDRNEIPHVMDFGLAKREAVEITMTTEGQVLGTPAYMAPEQAQGESHRVDRRADIFSLGVILFELLTGERPYRGNARMLIQQLLTKDPPTPRSLNGAVPRDLETITLRCLEKDPARRFQSAIDLKEELNRFLSGLPIRSRPVSRLEHFWRWCRRNPSTASLAFTSLLFLILGISLTSFWALLATNNASRLESELYFSQVENAHQQYLYNAVSDADQILESLPKRLRNWEWHYVKNQCLGDAISWEAHDNWVMSTDFHPNGKQFASASQDQTIKIWNAETRELVRTLRGHTGQVRGVAYSPDGSTLASGSHDNSVILWNADTGALLNRLVGHTKRVVCVAFNPSGTMLVSGGNDGTIMLWDVTTGSRHCTFEGHRDTVFSVTFSPDGRRIASGSFDATIKIWDVDDPQDVDTLEGHQDKVYCIRYLQDGKQLVSGGADNTIRFWDTTSGEELDKLDCPHNVISTLALSPDEDWLAVGSWDNSISLWKSRKLVDVLKGHGEAVFDLDFYPDGKRLLSAGKDHTLKIWDNILEDRKGVLYEDSQVKCVAISPNDELIASGTARGIVSIWLANAEQRLLQYDFGSTVVSDLAFHPFDPIFVAACDDGFIRYCSTQNHDVVREVTAASDSAKAVAFLPNGHLLSGGADGRIILWRAGASQGEVLNEVASSAIGGIAVSRGKPSRFAVGTRAGELLLFEAKNYTLIGRSTTGKELLGSVAFSPDGKLIAGGANTRQLVVWRVPSLDLVHRELVGVDGNPKVVFSRDGTRLVTGLFTGKVRMFEPRLLRNTLTVQLHEKEITSIAISNDGYRIITGSVDGTVRIMDAEPNDGE